MYLDCVTKCGRKRTIVYKIFNYVTNNDNYIFTSNHNMSIGNKLYEQERMYSRKLLENFIYDGIIDGTALQREWFGAVNTDVFISHSHKDLNQVKMLAGWLKKIFGLTSFIDSCIWGCCDDLLKEIDDKHCKNKNSNAYNYNLRNYSTSHVHAMLSTALTDMMDRSECIIFFNTPNSISINHEISNIKKDGDVTFSPWIYHELSTAVKLQINKPERIERDQCITENYGLQRYISGTINIGYDVTDFIKRMYKINENILCKWEKVHNPSCYSLDELYTIVHTC